MLGTKATDNVIISVTVCGRFVPRFMMFVVFDAKSNSAHKKAA